MSETETPFEVAERNTRGGPASGRRAARALSAQKSAGRVYTPESIVNDILNLSGYVGKRILKRHVIDNSCGDGAFLGPIVERYCRECEPRRLKRELEEFVHGIEIDAGELGKCVKRLDAVAARYGASGVRWDVQCGDALKARQYDGKMDFVLGNPPYIRVHNLGESFDSVKSFAFARGGMTDLYLVFYEIGLQMLNDRGVLGYITPSSFFNSLAGSVFRKRLAEENLLAKLVDLEHLQVFDVAAYTAVVVLEKARKARTVEFCRYENGPRFVAKLSPEDYLIDGKFYFSEKSELDELRRVLENGAGNRFEVKNGFATLCDSFFISDRLTGPRVVPVIKASTGKWTKALFPYADGKLIPYEQLATDPELKSYYEQNAKRLKARSLENPREWHAFGRTQGIRDVYKNKYSINGLIRDKSDIKLNRCPPGTGVYGGCYILTEIPFEELQELICSDAFVRYVSLLRKYKSGGYYAFSSRDLKVYLEHAYRRRFGDKNER